MHVINRKLIMTYIRQRPFVVSTELNIPSGTRKVPAYTLKTTG